MVRFLSVLMAWMRAVSGTVVVATGVVAANVVAANPVDGGHVEVALLAEVDAVRPGEDIDLLLRQRIDEGWHTYWINPGDSGQPTAVHWQLPDGFSAGPLGFPFPERMPYGPLVNFGYAGEVLFPVRLSVPDVLTGDSVTLRADVEWLACEEICIPEDASLELTLPVAAEGEQVRATSVALFAQARSLVPRREVLAAVADFRPAADDGPGRLFLQLDLPGMRAGRLAEAVYFPYREGQIENAPMQPFQMDASGVRIELVPGWAFSTEAGAHDGVVVLRERAGGMVASAYEIRPQASLAPVRAGVAEAVVGPWMAVLFAALGGLILNLMPCVFPVLSIKVLSLVGHVGGSPGLLRLHGVVYLVGAVCTFVAIAGALLLLRAGGSQIGWGFHLQSPLVVTLLIYLLFLVGLSLSGVLVLGGSLMDVGSRFSDRQGLFGSFATGALAVFVAAPCTAPFMGPAIGFAVTQSVPLALAVFASLGFGLALPYVVLCFSPALMRRLPRPGAWMETLKELLAFPMYGAAVWLLWVLSLQAGSSGVLVVGISLVLIVFAVWLLQRLDGAGGVAAWLGRGAVAAIVLVVLAWPAGLVPGMSALPGIAPGGPAVAAGSGRSGTGPVWQDWTPQAVATLREQGPVFVNFTAAWCITCKFNEQVALSSGRMAEVFEVNGVGYLKGDWTNEDPRITAALAEFGRNGVPLYLLYPPAGSDAAVRVLPQVLTEGAVIEAIEVMQEIKVL